MQKNIGISPTLEQGFHSLEKLGGSCSLPTENPYSRLRTLLAMAMEKYAHHQSGQLLPMLSSQDERRDFSLISRLEAHQTAILTPYHFSEENDCRHGILLSMLSMELTAVLAQYLKDGPLRQALHFLLPEFLDETYRLSNLLLLLFDETAQEMLGGYSEIMPGRPLISCHRHPYDEVCLPLSSDDPLENMAPILLSAVLAMKQEFSQQAAFHEKDALARALFLEISLMNQGQLTRLLSLLPARNPLQQMYLIQYAESYLYDSLSQDEDLPVLRQLYLEEKENEGAHLEKILRLMKNAEEAPPLFSTLPERLRLGPNKGYIRDVLQNVGVTALREKYTPVGALPEGADFFRYQQRICPHPEEIPSHLCVSRVIDKFGMDYRFEIAPHPIECLRNRSCDHQQVGR